MELRHEWQSRCDLRRRRKSFTYLGGHDKATSVAIQNEGKIVVAGLTGALASGWTLRWARCGPGRIRSAQSEFIEWRKRSGTGIQDRSR